MNKTEYEQLKKINKLVEATAKITANKKAYGLTIKEIRSWRKDIEKSWEKAERKREREQKKLEKELRYREKYPDWEMMELRYFMKHRDEIYEKVQKNPNYADTKDIYPFYRDA
ncbi:hypothetical protein [Enterococcus gallinarum]|uniref:hypothetical protein n=1 Tax=Enterococcus gallinarum TaxID=1353 RepID=UPI001CAA65A4|nr:hypothetical protein [Enterococcus gallinarum]HAQ0366260.1 hypothetical protein [Enterococcus faecium]